MIPKLIHQTWRDDTPPEGAMRARDQVLRLNPGWSARLYTDTDVKRYVARAYGADVLRSLQRIAPEYGAARADLFRYLLLYDRGGVYLDIKSTTDRPLDEVLLPDDVYLLSQWRNGPGMPHARWGLHRELAHVPGGEFQQWHIVAAPRHPFLRHVIRAVLANIEAYDVHRHGVGKPAVLRLTGPICYTRAIVPLLARARHRRVDAAADLGLRYSVYEEDGRQLHRQALTGHYSLQRTPVIRPAAPAA